MLDSDAVKMVSFINAHKAVDYDAGIRGANCPVCGEIKAKTYTTGTEAGGAVVRYHKCRGCGLNFKSIEEK